MTILFYALKIDINEPNFLNGKISNECVNILKIAHKLWYTISNFRL